MSEYTTVRLKRGLWKAVKRRAKEQRRSITAVIDEAVRIWIMLYERDYIQECVNNLFGKDLGWLLEPEPEEYYG